MSTEIPPTFAALGLSEPLLRAVHDTGYEAPSRIQAEAIPPLLAGRDLLGQAQTGTGKTAAFALPLLQRLDLARRRPQLLVLVPTRELAIQVAEAMQTYARHLPGFHVLPVYGGQGMDTQLRHLARGVHAVVGTPGRVADHLRRGSLDLGGVAAVVLDEADEMLRMGFIEEVSGILERTPAEKQVALFSATLPPAIAGIARAHLRHPVEVRIETATATVASVTQRYWQASGAQKLNALTRILEAEAIDGMLVFVRTRNSTVELAEKLEARGYDSAALNGDMPQSLRERVVDRLRRGRLDIVVATDVAARGLDVDRISHVVNYDIPYDVEAYVHRIGRTGRAGRAGAAILFVGPRERRMLRLIEQATGQPILHMRLPSNADISDRRTTRFKQLIGDTLANERLDHLAAVIADYQAEQGVDPLQIAAALAFHVQRERPLQGDGAPGQAPGQPPPRRAEPAPSKTPPAARGQDAQRPAAPRPPAARPPALVEEAEAPTLASAPPGALAGSDEARSKQPEPDAQAAGKPVSRQRMLESVATARYRVAVGGAHGVEPKHIVGAIANEAGLESRFIGRVEIGETHSTVELPEGMPRAIFKHLRKVWVRGRQLNIERDASTPRGVPPDGGSAAAAPKTTASRNKPGPGGPRPAASSPGGRPAPGKRALKSRKGAGTRGG